MKLKRKSCKGKRFRSTSCETKSHVDATAVLRSNRLLGLDDSAFVVELAASFIALCSAGT